MKGDKNLFFLILSFVCFWLVLDQYYGKKLISKFVGGITGNLNSVGDSISNNLTDTAGNLVDKVTDGKYSESKKDADYYLKYYKDNNLIRQPQIDFLTPILSSENLTDEAFKQASSQVWEFKNWSENEKRVVNNILSQYQNSLRGGKK